MLIVDQLNKADRHLRVLSWVIAIGLFALLVGLWWVQVVRSRSYVEDQRNQSYRTVRVPAPRGRVLDRNGVALADNRASYSISLYLEDRSWRDAVQQEYKRAEEAAKNSGMTARKPKIMERFLSLFGFKPNLVQPRKLTSAEKVQLGRETRFSVTSNIVWQLGAALGERLLFTNEVKFHQHYEQRRALPLPILADLNANQIARFQEQSTHLPAVDMEMQPMRIYPKGTLAAHVVGCLTHFDDESAPGDLASFNYHLPDYKGYDGIEKSLDADLRGRAGAKAVLVNNLGYRQSETILSPIEAGQNVTLTIDAEIQRVAEKELRDGIGQKPTRGAAVVLDVRTGEIIALASAPTFDPRDWVPRLSPEIWNTYTNDDIAPMRNRCVYGYYFPGSTFKTVVALAALEAGVIDPETVYRSKGYYQLGKRQPIGDPAGPGDFNFKRAFKRSSNSYFIEYGLQVGRDAIVAVGEHLHFGEKTGVPLAQDSRGILPTREWMRQNLGGWSEGDTANLCIGQGYVDVTPLQMAVAIAAVANGGRVLWPQLVLSVQSQDALVDPAAHRAVQPRIRDQLPVSARTLSVIQAAMLADTEEGDGTGTASRVPGYRICGKTGTAQVQKHNRLDHYTVWFASYAPYEDPRYAVVVMIDYGASGGVNCAPIAGKIFRALKYRDERTPPALKNSMALK
jgi:penicillin-binding protein 2